ncbi:MAG: hypothetical protein ACP5NO_07000 [Thermoplasmata archaeon]
MNDLFSKLPKPPKLLSRIIIIEYGTLAGVIVYSISIRNIAILAIGLIGIPIIYALQRLGAA